MMPAFEYNDVLIAAKRNLLTILGEHGVPANNIEAVTYTKTFSLIAYFNRKLSCDKIGAAVEKYKKSGHVDNYKVSDVTVQGYRDQLMIDFEITVTEKSRSKECFDKPAKKPAKKASKPAAKKPAKPAKKPAAKKK